MSKQDINLKQVYSRVQYTKRADLETLRSVFIQLVQGLYVYLKHQKVNY